MKKTTQNNYQLPQNLFLTMPYQPMAEKSTNDITREDLLAFYNETLGSKNIIQMEISLEHHKDGN